MTKFEQMKLLVDANGAPTLEEGDDVKSCRQCVFWTRLEDENGGFGKCGIFNFDPTAFTRIGLSRTDYLGYWPEYAATCKYRTTEEQQ